MTTGIRVPKPFRRFHRKFFCNGICYEVLVRATPALRDQYRAVLPAPAFPAPLREEIQEAQEAIEQALDEILSVASDVGLEIRQDHSEDEEADDNHENPMPAERLEIGEHGEIVFGVPLEDAPEPERTRPEPPAVTGTQEPPVHPGRGFLESKFEAWQDATLRILQATYHHFGSVVTVLLIIVGIFLAFLSAPVLTTIGVNILIGIIDAELLMKLWWNGGLMIVMGIWKVGTVFLFGVRLVFAIIRVILFYFFVSFPPTVTIPIVISVWLAAGYEKIEWR